MKVIRHTHPHLWLMAGVTMALLTLGTVRALPDRTELIAGFALTALAVLMLLRGRYDAGEQSGEAPGPVAGAGSLLAKMAPTILLMLTFPVVIPTVNSIEIGGVPAGQVLLAVSVSVPWLSQAVATSFYRHFWDLKDQRAMSQVAGRIFSRWPEILLATLPVSAIFTLAVALITDWPAVTIAYVAAGLVLHSVFAQSHVLVNQTRSNGLWILSWVLYTLTILLFPEYWLLAPVAGTVPNLIIVAARGTSIHRPTGAELVQHAADTGRGFLTGSVLWADKFVLLLLAGATYDIFSLYVALIPAMLAYSYYFAQLAPNFDLAVVKANRAIHQGSVQELRKQTTRLSDIVSHAITRTFAVASVSALAVTVLMPLMGGPELPLELVVTPIAAMLITILAYKLEYIGHHGAAVSMSAVHLLAVLLLAVLPSVIAFSIILTVDVLLVVWGYFRIRQVWGSMPYQMFWRFATKW